MTQSIGVFFVTFPDRIISVRLIELAMMNSSVTFNLTCIRNYAFLKMVFLTWTSDLLKEKNNKSLLQYFLKIYSKHRN